MNINRGKKIEAQKVVLYGPEGIGKSTFGSQYPNPLFIDTEGSTSNLDVARMDAPSSFQMIMQQIAYVNSNPSICDTLVLDTADWAEKLCIEEFCAKKQLSGIEDIGYGKGYIYIAEDFGKMLNALEEVKKKGINIVVTAHAQMRKFEQPDELGAYDRWELKLAKKIAPLLKEWADMVLFANYKTIVVNVDSQGAQKGKNKAQGGKRVMYTEHHPCWDAKNRHGLPEELPFEYKAIAHCIPIRNKEAVVTPAPQQTVVKQEEKQAVVVADISAIPVPVPPPTQVAPTATPTPAPPQRDSGIDIRVPVALADLMEQNKVTEVDIQLVVSMKGYYPIDTPIWNYDDNFIKGVLVGAWTKVLGMINENRK